MAYKKKIKQEESNIVEELGPSVFDAKLKDFLTVNTKAKVAIVVPLFGYWKDVVDNPLGVDTLKVVLDRIHSSVYQTYVLFVGAPSRIPTDIQNTIYVYSQAGNAKGVEVAEDASYGEYLREGIGAAVEDTDAAFVVMINPWTIIQHNAVDVIVDRINRGDSAKIVSGYDLSESIAAELFDSQVYQIPKEERDLNLNFAAITRAYAQTLEIDPEIKTHLFIARDIWQTMYSKGYDVITTQRVPIFPFKIGWTNYEPVGDFEADKQYFIKKWGFDPGLTAND